jgi:hypothetical protein
LRLQEAVQNNHKKNPYPELKQIKFNCGSYVQT